MSFLFRFLLFACIAHTLHAERSMNFLVVLIDDMGLTDLGCHGSKLDAWRASVGAQAPLANPDYDPAKDVRGEK